MTSNDNNTINNYDTYNPLSINQVLIKYEINCKKNNTNNTDGSINSNINQIRILIPIKLNKCYPINWFD